MATGPATLPDVYDAREIARAAGRPLAVVTALIDSGRVSTIDGEYVSHAEAVRLLAALRSGRTPDVVAAPSPLFSHAARGSRETAVPLAASTAVHALLVAVALLLAIVGRGEVTEALATSQVEPVRLVFLATPGPGGGGGGGGVRHVAPPEPARRTGHESLTSPVPPPPPDPIPEPKPEVRPPEPEPPSSAPVASVAADTTTKTGVIEESKATDSKSAKDPEAEREAARSDRAAASIRPVCCTRSNRTIRKMRGAAASKATSTSKSWSDATGRSGTCA
jgi:hypothetical protein